MTLMNVVLACAAAGIGSWMLAIASELRSRQATASIGPRRRR